jgi:hypothetical protein
LRGNPLSSLVDVLLQEGLDAVRHVLRDAIGCHRDYSPCQTHQATKEHNRISWETAVRIEKILCTVCTRHTSGRSRRRWRHSQKGPKPPAGEWFLSAATPSLRRDGKDLSVVG